MRKLQPEVKLPWSLMPLNQHFWFVSSPKMVSHLCYFLSILTTPIGECMKDLMLTLLLMRVIFSLFYMLGYGTLVRTSILMFFITVLVQCFFHSVVIKYHFITILDIK